MDVSLAMEWLRREDLADKTISYAQNHEDILLGRALPSSEGLYVDVGANHPVFHSVTKHFYDRGWSGINIEPSPPVFEVLNAARPRDLNLNIGVGDHSGTLTFYDTPDRHGWASFRPELAAHYESIGVEVVERPVPIRTLADICAEHVGDRTIDFLKIDAEGFEQQVIQGADFARWRPRIVVIENFGSDIWGEMILGAGYYHAAFDGLNRYFVRHEDRDLLLPLQAPVNILDGFIPHEYLRLVEQLETEARFQANAVVFLRDLMTQLHQHSRLDTASMRAIRAWSHQLYEQRPRLSLIEVVVNDGGRVARKLGRLLSGRTLRDRRNRPKPRVAS